jgi:hypothetical protein
MYSAVLSPNAARTKGVCCWEVPGSKLVLPQTERCRHVVSFCDSVFVIVREYLGLCTDDK